MNNELKRILIISAITSIGSYYLIKFLDSKKVLPPKTEVAK